MNQIRRVVNLLEQRLKGDNKNEKILERLDQYRAIEINNLWQRSVFLGTFLVLGYTGYGFLVDKMLPVKCKDESQLLHFLACALACVNIIFSVLWIAMAKGSKAWYEAYENAIAFVENAEKELNWKEVRCEIDLRRREMNQDKGSKNQNKQCEDRNSSDKFKNIKNDCIFSTKSGGYSPAKINIALGQISLILWLFVLITHIVILCKDTYEIISKDVLVFLLFLIVWSTICVISNLNQCKEWIKSSYFQD